MVQLRHYLAFVSLSIAYLELWQAEAGGVDLPNSYNTKIVLDRQIIDDCGRAPMNKRSTKNQKSLYLNGGKNQIYGEWPSFATISVRLGFDTDTPGNMTLCSGVIISRTKVLTAGHCLTAGETRLWNTKDLIVTTGDHRINYPDKHQRSFGVNSTCKSSAYTRSPFNRYSNDYAILNLSSAIEHFDNYTRPACLPQTTPEFDTKKGHCHVIGVGYIHHEGPPDGFGSDIIQFPEIVQTMPVKRQSCDHFKISVDRLDSSKPRSIEDPDESQFCWTKSGGNGTICKGDSGGPILCLNENDRWTVIGLASYGSILCDGKELFGFTGVYAKVQTALGRMQECFKGDPVASK